MPKLKRKYRDTNPLAKLVKIHSGAKEKRLRTMLLNNLRLERPKYWWRERNLWQKGLCILLAIVLFLFSGMYGIAEWYIWQERNQPLKMGVTFIPSYAHYFGLDPKDTMQAMIDELGVKHFRLVSYWEEIEPKPGVYDFSGLDWQFDKAEATGATISLAIGLRQPRWPECHMPDWAQMEPKDEWYPQLKEVMNKIIDRYKVRPTLINYQLENEYFLEVFGQCRDFSRDRLIDEFNFVKELDPLHPVIISRSNNWVGVPVNEPTPDEYAISVYKRVWDRTLTRRYVEYPYPAWYYAFYAGASKILQGKDMIIHELQAEPWMPDNFDLATSPLSEQDKSLNARRLKDRFEYGKATGMKEIYLWGAEYWFWRKVHFNDPSLWNVAKQEISDSNTFN